MNQKGWRWMPRLNVVIGLFLLMGIAGCQTTDTLPDAVPATTEAVAPMMKEPVTPLEARQPQMAEHNMHACQKCADCKSCDMKSGCDPKMKKQCGKKSKSCKMAGKCKKCCMKTDNSEKSCKKCCAAKSKSQQRPSEGKGCKKCGKSEADHSGKKCRLPAATPSDTDTHIHTTPPSTTTGTGSTQQF
ncbi:MAG: hypothetical protein HQM00_15455 [Magnetococcales bacterium]|nr:hypothetical protein [Magnetococcales bacterium]